MVNKNKIPKTCQGFVLIDAVVGLVLWGIVAHMAFPILSQLVRVHSQQIVNVTDYLDRYNKALQTSATSIGDTIALCADSNLNPPLYYGCWQQGSDISDNPTVNE